MQSPKRGKSRTGKGIIYVAYRGDHVSSLREPNIFRYAENFGGSLFFDVRDIWKKAIAEKSDDILLDRFEKGKTVSRVLYPEKGPFEDTRSFKIFGPTIIATNRNISTILETRAIHITMPDTKKRFDLEIKKLLALPLKERLLEFRLRHLNKPLPKTPKLFYGRFGDITRPLVQIMRLVAPHKEKEFMELLYEIEIDRKQEKSEGLEARVLKAIAQLETTADKHGGKISTQEIADNLNIGVPERHHVISQQVGYLTKALGFIKTRLSDGKTAVLFDRNKLNHLMIQYGLTNPSESSEPSKPINSNGSEGSEGSEGYNKNPQGFANEVGHG